jgi:hypothetical protein
LELRQANVSDENAERVPLVSRERRCSVSGCQARHYAKEYCKKHYTQVLRHGKLTPDRERGVVRVCKVDGCERTDTIQWYCRKHARQLRVHGRLTPEREHIMGFEGCRVPKCNEPHRAKGYCAKHYNQDRWRRLKKTRTPATARGKKSPGANNRRRVVRARGRAKR